jgi:hypothetical protein
MMEQNLELATKIEAALAAQGLPTFKTYLQQDLARRQAARNGGTGAANGIGTMPASSPGHGGAVGA